MAGYHVIPERGVWSSVESVSEMFVKSQTNISFCFSDVSVPRLLFFTKLTGNFIHHIFGMASAAQSISAGRTFATPSGTGGRVQCRACQTLLKALVVFPRHFEGKPRCTNSALDLVCETVVNVGKRDVCVISAVSPVRL